MTQVLDRDVLAELRAATAAAHRHLEASLNLMDPALDLACYRRILCRFHGFWKSWQPRVAALLDDPGFTNPRDRRPLLAADLACLGLTRGRIAAIPTCPPPPLDNASAATGSLYVMEGSTLGGRQILNTLARLGLTPASGASYFAGYGAETGTMWRAFLPRLAATTHPADVIAGATQTFASLSAWLAQP